MEDWRCPSSYPYYFTHHSDVLTGDKRHTNISNNNHIISDTRGQLAAAESGGQLAARSLGDSASVVVAVTAATGDDHGLTTAAVPYVVATMGCLLMLLVIVGVASYVTAAHS